MTVPGAVPATYGRRTDARTPGLVKAVTAHVSRSESLIAELRTFGGSEGRDDVPDDGWST